MKLEIQAIGNPRFPRFIIVNDKNEVFDGTSWNEDAQRAVLYVEGQEIAVQFRALEEAIYESLPLREFRVTMNIRVRSGQDFTNGDLAAYLERAACILLDHAKGTGPVESSHVQLDVTWDGITEAGSVDDKAK